MWKPEHRQAAERRSQRYPSDLTDAEWALVEPLIPPALRFLFVLYLDALESGIS